MPTGFGLLARTLSPAYQLNPFDLNPLREALLANVDFELSRASKSPRLLVAAMRVRQASLRIFRNSEISVESVFGLGLSAAFASHDRN